MKKIIIHWTAGTYKPTQQEKGHYHFLIDGVGKIHNGTFKPEDNLDCTDNNYAAHTGGGNTGSIGVSLCSMFGFKNSKNIGNYPMTKIQAEACWKLCAELCKKHNIPIVKETVLTHYEFGQANPKTSSKGKIDIIMLPFEPYLKANQIGEYIRGKISWYLNKI